MRIGIFSGTFDPVHRGHVAFAASAVEEFSLEKLLFLPEAKPRRKKQVTALDERVKMLKLAIANKEHLNIFISRTSSHTVGETMQELHNDLGRENDYYLLMGVDVFEHIENWPDYKQLLVENSIILVLRTEDDGEVALEVAKRLKIEPKMVVSSFPDVSSSKIRRAIEDGENVEGLTEEVLEYAINHRLYE